MYWSIENKVYPLLGGRPKKGLEFSEISFQKPQICIHKKTLVFDHISDKAQGRGDMSTKKCKFFLI